VAYDRSQIKTVEGVINYIDANPNLAQNLDQPAPVEGQQADENLESISGHVNQALVQELVQLGYVKDVAEKGLFMTGGASIDKAVEWLEQHKGDADYLEPLFIVKADKNKPQLSPEEAKKRAKELQQQIRENRAKREKEAELEQERNRLKFGKDMLQVKREVEEAQMRQDIDYLKREREEKERAKQKILDEIEKDRRNRGMKPQAKIIHPAKQVFADIHKKMRTVYPDPNVVKVCIQTCALYLGRAMLIQAIS